MADPSTAELQAEIEALRTHCAEVSPAAERFRQVFEHAQDGIFLVRPGDQRFIDANPAACRLVGYSREELLELTAETLHAHETKLLGAFCQQVLRDGHGFSDQLSCQRKDGNRVEIEVTSARVGEGDDSYLVMMARDVSRRRRAERETVWLREQVATELAFGEIIGTSSPLQAVLEQIALVGPTDTSVLITGESGTGKELVARAIHRESARVDKPMVKVNCGSIPRELFESEFFGHVRGAFTGAVRDREGRFELAEGGTLFLDEVGEIPIELQPKLLRVLQEGTYERVGEGRERTADVRLIAATNRDLQVAVDAGAFRSDLYYRLSVFPIAVPPLRERCADIPAIADYFAREAAQRLGRPDRPLAPESHAGLCSYDWPGNVRELQNMIERAVIVSRGEHLVLDIPAVHGGPPAPAGRAAAADPDRVYTEDEMLAFERRNLERALRQAGGRVRGVGGAAELLGVKPTTLASRLKKLGIH